MNIFEKLKEAMKTVEVDKPVTLIEAKKGYRICIEENGDIHYIPETQVIYEKEAKMKTETESNDYKNGYNQSCEDMINLVNDRLVSEYGARESIFSTLLAIKDHILRNYKRG